MTSRTGPDRVPRLPATDLLRVELRPASGDGDTELLHRWARQTHVAPWWPELLGTTADVAAHLADRIAAPHSAPWFLLHDERPVGYVEVYLAVADPLASHYEADPGDRGWHVLVGPAELLGSGIPRLLVRAVLARLLNEPACARIVCEPDVRNRRMIAFSRRLGHEVLGEVDLPGKKALVMACRADRFDALWPDDRGVVGSTAPLHTHDPPDEGTPA